ncbi:MAG: GGDEF domain-containing protein [Lachnospiraceae bacterium]|nr:GGDEF domain-containing protein [Lachnospiraceae bacterium]
MDSSLHNILKEEKIKTVYQPIFSLSDGSVYAYEALSRIDVLEPKLNIQELFDSAEKENKLWELEKLCRIKALQNATAKPLNTKLFLNVDPNIIQDSEMKKGFTYDAVQKYGLNPKEIVFEITERSAINSMPIFTASIEHYQKQNYSIAIDDFGSGYSGMNRVCSFSPDYIKIDIELIRGVNTNAMKKSAITSIVQFCKEANIKTIAEGIETEGELTALIETGVDYGQGFFLCRPNEKFSSLSAELKMMIKVARQKVDIESGVNLFGDVELLCSNKHTVSRCDKAIDVYEKIKDDESFAEVIILNEDNTVYGMITRGSLIQKFSGQFGYNLSSRRLIAELSHKDFLSVDCKMPIDAVANIAMKRNVSQIYDSIIVTKDNRFLGIVTVMDLLIASINVRVKRASEASPLTGLPGNWAVQSIIFDTIKATEPFSVIYLDLDNFKAYNDAYGFSNGDLMITAVSKAMKENCDEKDFLGHIGGDDFVIIAKRTNVISLCQEIIKSFESFIKPLYLKEDWERGYIVSKNRNGFVENFPITTLSIAVITNENGDYQSVEQLSKTIAITKKKCKLKIGNVIEVADSPLK